MDRPDPTDKKYGTHSFTFAYYCEDLEKYCDQLQAENERLNESLKDAFILKDIEGDRKHLIDEIHQLQAENDRLRHVIESVQQVLDLNNESKSDE